MEIEDSDYEVGDYVEIEDDIDFSTNFTLLDTSNKIDIDLELESVLLSNIEDDQLVEIPPIDDRNILDVPTRDLSEMKSCESCGRTFYGQLLLTFHNPHCSAKGSELSKMYVSNAPKMLRDILNEAIEDPIFNLAPPGTYAAALAVLIKDRFDKYSDSFQSFATSISQTLNDIVSKEGKKPVGNILSKFHSISVEVNLTELFKSFLSSIDIEVKNDNRESLLIQFILEKFFQNLLSLHNKFDELGFSDQIDARKLSLTDDEQTTLRYVAGYIPYSLLKYFKKLKVSDERDIYIKVIKSWGKADLPNSGFSLLEYSNQWIDLVDRGGLFHVTDNFYRFIVRVEITARTVLNKDLIQTYAGQDLRHVIKQKLLSDPFVKIGYDSLVRSIENKTLTEKLKELIFEKWISIRANSFVKAWVNLVKFQQNKSNKKVDCKAQPGLRKTLSC